MVKEGSIDTTLPTITAHFISTSYFLSQTLFGRNLYALRLPVVLASLGAVWLALKYDRVIPRPVARTAALAMALSPGFIFYGRYSIHEAWLLLFSMMFIFGLLGLWREGH
jgi:hypothetical protein